MFNNLILYLYGGGEDVKNIDLSLIADINKYNLRKKILFVADAKNKPTESFFWFSDYWRKYRIEVELLDLKNFSTKEILEKIRETDCVYLGAGNTFQLNKVILSSNFKKIIIERSANSPLILAGFSAGAIVMGTTIISALTVDATDEKYNPFGMDFIPSMILVHYKNNSVTEMFLSKYKDYQVKICLPENTGLKISNGKATAICNKNLEVVVINNDSKKHYANDQIIKI